MLLVNNTSKDLTAFAESVGNGDRTTVTARLPAASPKANVYWTGLFAYDKNQVVGLSMGFFGSCFGISFVSELGPFSIGMDCPNSLGGGRNSIAILDREHANDAMITARDNYKNETSISSKNRNVTA